MAKLWVKKWPLEISGGLFCLDKDGYNDQCLRMDVVSGKRK